MYLVGIFIAIIIISALRGIIILIYKLIEKRKERKEYDRDSNS
jgi:Na+-driven multidrug efflux pump